jgi:uncharacterized protein (TIGR00251 family)
MSFVVPHAEGCVLSVKAQPGARRNAVVALQNDRLKVAVQAPPDKGKANDAIEAVLIEALSLKRSQVELLAGPASRDKKFLIRGTEAADIERKVKALLQR